MSADFLLELLSEEIPARMQAKARNDLARMFAEKLAEAGLSRAYTQLATLLQMFAIFLASQLIVVLVGDAPGQAVPFELPRHPRTVHPRRIHEYAEFRGLEPAVLASVDHHQGGP